MGHGDNTGDSQTPTIKRTNSLEKPDNEAPSHSSQDKLRREGASNPLTAQELKRFGPQDDHAAQLVAFYPEQKGSGKDKTQKGEPSNDRQNDAAEKADPDKPLFGIHNASIAKRDSAGQVEKKDGKPDFVPLKDVLDANKGRLPAGDYELRFALKDKEGKDVSREGRLFIPPRDLANSDKPMPLMVAVHGVNPLHPNTLFSKNLPLDKVAEKRDTAIFWPYAQRLQGEGASNSNYVWNMPDALRDNKVVQRQIEKDGYDDGQFILESLKVAEQSANAESKYLLGHSQGASVAMKLASLPEAAGKFEKVALFCGATNNKIESFPEPSDGNAKDVFIFHPGGDKLVFTKDDLADTSKTLLAGLKTLGQGMLGLDDVDTKNASPTQLIKYYMNLLGTAYSQNTFVSAAQSLSNGIKDFNIGLKDQSPYVAGSKTARDTLFEFVSPSRKLRIVHAPKATHVPPGMPGAIAAMDFLKDKYRLYRRLKG